MVSVFQSICFNYWLFQRLRERRLPGLMTGDVILGLPFGQRPFTSDDAEQVMERVKRGELTVAGPLIGPKMMQASSEALAFEQECWTSMGLTKSFCEAHPALDKGARRPAYVPVLSPSWVHNSEGLHLQFSLPKGSFAAVFLHHVLPGQIDDFALETQ